MSRRTLQRRLAEQDVAFLELLDRARRELVYSLLRTPRYRLSEIAFLAGYADQSAFSRAFRRWEGQTPAEFRRAAGSGG
ncbi:MAG: helix-turn-helix transcriptional regulator [Pseudomonadota bacterium]